MAPDEAGIALMAGERVLKCLKPHPLAFWDMYLIWMWVIILGVLFMAYGDDISRLAHNPLGFATGYLEGYFKPSDRQIIRSIPLLPDVNSAIRNTISAADRTVNAYNVVGVWVIALLASAVVVSVIKIEWKWVALLLGIGLTSIIVSAYLRLPTEGIYYVSIVFSIIGLAAVEIYRHAHTFVITDRRIVTQVKWGGHRRNELSFDKINNIILEQGLIGSIFDFGTIIPVTASGLGMGSDFTAVTGGISGQLQQGPTVGVQVTGGRSVQTPRVRSMYGLFGVSHPEEIQRILSEQMHAYVEAPYLKRVTEQLEDLKRK